MAIDERLLRLENALADVLQYLSPPKDKTAEEIRAIREALKLLMKDLIDEKEGRKPKP